MGLERSKLDSRYKVEKFLADNPVSQTFIKREKGRLPYSVFKPHAEEPTFLMSIFKNRPATMFFQYPSYVKTERTCDRIFKYTVDESESLFLSFRILDSAHIYNAVVNSCKGAGLQLLDGAADTTKMFNLQWTGYILP